MEDVIVVGGGFAGRDRAREAAAWQGRRVLLLEARDRLGGRTWTAPWHEQRIEYGGGWVHWHQPHTFSEITRAGLTVELSARSPTAPPGTSATSGAAAASPSETPSPIAAGDRFVDGVEQSLPNPHDPLLAIDRAGRVRRAHDRRADRAARTGRRAARGAVGGARVAGARAARRRRRRQRAALARALGLQPGAHPVHRRPRHPRRRHRCRCSTRSPRRRRSRRGCRRRWRRSASTATRSRWRRGPASCFGASLLVVRGAAEHAGRDRHSARPCPRRSARASRWARPRAESRSSSEAEGAAASQNAIRPGHPFGYLDTEFQTPTAASS